MKKIKYWALALVAFITVGFTFTSCVFEYDPDVEESRTLDGEWKGYFGMYFVDKYGYQWESSYSIIEFHQTGFNRGWAEQYDCYARGPITYEYYRFNWTVRNGVIYLDYPYNSQLNAVIYNYRMTPYTFDGHFQGSGTYFQLDKYRNFNWGYYNGGYGNYDYYYGYDDSYIYNGYPYWAKTRANVTDSTVVAPKMDDNNNQDIIVKHGNRFMENK